MASRAGEDGQVSYQGYVRVIGEGGNILDVAEASLGSIDHPGHRWGGTMTVWSGGALDGKTMMVDLEVPGSFRAPALILPGPVSGKQRQVSVLGSGDSPFSS